MTPCTITVNSQTTGVATVNASATVVVGGVSINVATNGYGAFQISNTKTWVAQPAINIKKATNAANPLSPTPAEDADTPTGPIVPVAQHGDAGHEPGHEPGHRAAEQRDRQG